MIEQDEEIIKNLEELDTTFSRINKVLRSLKNKVEAIEETNRAIIRDCSPLREFFALGDAQRLGLEEDAAGSEVPNTVDTQSFLKHSSPMNPFRRRDGVSTEVSRSPPNDISSIAEETAKASDSMVSELVEFDQDLLPEGFRDIEEVQMIYYFVEKRRSVSLDEIYVRFGNVSRELMDIFLDVLIRKNFVRLSNRNLVV